METKRHEEEIEEGEGEKRKKRGNKGRKRKVKEMKDGKEWKLGKRRIETRKLGKEDEKENMIKKRRKGKK